MTQNVTGSSQIINAPYPVGFGAVATNNATTPNTKIDVSAGIWRDQSNTFDMNLGNYNGVNANLSVDSVTVIDATTNGVNGLDTGTLTASRIYYVYIISDFIYGSTASIPKCLISLTGPATGPLLPSGYGIYRWVDIMVTDSSAHFLPVNKLGNSNTRTIMYDAPQATAVTAGNATSYTAAALTNLVPAIDGTPVWIASAFTPGAASRILNLTPYGGTGNAIAITGQVTSVVVTSNSFLASKLNSGAPSISYKVSNSGDAAALNVAGFQIFL